MTKKPLAGIVVPLGKVKQRAEPGELIDSVHKLYAVTSSASPSSKFLISTAPFPVLFPGGSIKTSLMTAGTIGGALFSSPRVPVLSMYHRETPVPSLREAMEPRAIRSDPSTE